jgi:NAD(P)-dependent dehydrogenase (short-subunit alcohol dehydrogenase family)
MYKNKVVLITGAGSGIGRVSAFRFAAEGAKLCAADIDLDAARKTAAEIESQGHSAFATQADVTSSVDNQRMIEETCRQYGLIDVAYLNAGYLGPMDGLDGMDEAAFDRIIDINLKAVFLGIKALLGNMNENAAIVVTGSTSSIRGLDVAPLYSAAKHGVAGLVKSVAPTLAEHKIRINMVAPGLVNTPMMGFQDGDKLRDPASLTMIPHLEGANPQYIAETVLFLGSPAAGYLNGSILVADGGLMTGHPIV